jgi:dipeptidyl aminopeptidase/acylaminoacyl peptidase
VEDGLYDIGHVDFLDAQTLVFSGASKKEYGTSENAALYTMPLAPAQPRLVAAPDRCLCSAIGSDCRFGSGTTFKVDGGALYFTMACDNATALWRMERDGALKQLTQGEGSVDAFDVHEGEIFAVAMLEMKLQEIYHLNAGDSVLSPLSAFNAAVLEHKYVALPQKHSFVNADGVRIDGWALLPQGFSTQGSYPAILDIHGGPKAIYGEVFCHEMQFWANRGYVVLFCNPRGSGGRGNAFADLRDRYGTVDYADIMDFTDQMLARFPQIDPARVCVTGGSYGGFMTNWIIGHTQRFAAAASQRSISNWVSKCLATDIGYYHNLDQIHGDPWKTPEKFWDRSPLKYAPQAKTPTLFIHSNEDYRCWMAEGLQMFTALKMHGVPARLCLFKGENHELSRSGVPAHRVRRLKEITDWFDTYTRPAEK